MHAHTRARHGMLRGKCHWRKVRFPSLPAKGADHWIVQIWICKMPQDPFSRICLNPGTVFQRSELDLRILVSGSNIYTCTCASLSHRLGTADKWLKGREKNLSRSQRGRSRRDKISPLGSGSSLTEAKSSGQPDSLCARQEGGM